MDWLKSNYLLLILVIFSFIDLVMWFLYYMSPADPEKRKARKLKRANKKALKIKAKAEKISRKCKMEVSKDD